MNEVMQAQHLFFCGLSEVSRKVHASCQTKGLTVWPPVVSFSFDADATEEDKTKAAAFAAAYAWPSLPQGAMQTCEQERRNAAKEKERLAKEAEANAKLYAEAEARDVAAWELKHAANLKANSADAALQAQHAQREHKIQLTRQYEREAYNQGKQLRARFTVAT